MSGDLLLNLLKAMYWFFDAMQDNMEAQGFKRTTRAATFILLNVAQGEHRATKIARNLGISRQAVSQVLFGLKDRGMVEIREDPDDRRSQIVNFTPEFAEQGAACIEILAKLENEIGQRVGSDRLKVVRYALAEDWGKPPLMGPLSPKEVLHGKALWKKKNELAAISNESETSKGKVRAVRSKRKMRPRPK